MAAHRGLNVSELPAGLGLDLGSSLAKAAHVGGGDVQFDIMPVSEADRIESLVGGVAEGLVALTGAGAAHWSARLASDRVVIVPEFEANAAGARLLLDGVDLDIRPPYLLVSVGTGTSALLVTADGVSRVGGTALGGGTLMGLGALLCETRDYPDLIDLAARGNRQEVDLLVRDVYPGGLEALPGELTAASFGRIRAPEREHIAHALCGLLGENVGLLCGGLARLHGAESVLYCGAALLDNPVLAGILVATTTYAGALAHVLPDGAYCGALGALSRSGWQGQRMS